jgi:hypothetical protein
MPALVLSARDFRPDDFLLLAFLLGFGVCTGALYRDLSFAMFFPHRIYSVLPYIIRVRARARVIQYKCDIFPSNSAKLWPYSVFFRKITWISPP